MNYKPLYGRIKDMTTRLGLSSSQIVEVFEQEGLCGLSFFASTVCKSKPKLYLSGVNNQNE